MLLCVVKLVLVDIRYDNVLLRAAGFLSEASFALVSVLYTIWSTSGWGGAKMQKTEKILAIRGFIVYTMHCCDIDSVEA